MPDPATLRKLTIIFAIALIASRSNGFSIHRMTTDDTDLTLSTDTDQAPQESFKAKSVTSLNVITRDKEDGKVKNRYKFTSEIALQDSTEETTLDTIQDTESTIDSSVTGLPSTNPAVTIKTNTDLKVTGLKSESKFNQSRETSSNTGTSLLGSTVDLSGNFLDNNTKFLDITTNNSDDYTVQTSPKAESKTNVTGRTRSILSSQGNEYITTMSSPISHTKDKITNSTKILKLNDQMAIDSASTKGQIVKNTTENVAGILNIKKESKIHRIQLATISNDENEKLNKSTESTDILATRVDANMTSITTFTTPHSKLPGHNKNEKLNITTESTDIVFRTDSNSIRTSTTTLDKNKNENSNIKTESTVIAPSKTYLDSMKTYTTPLDNNNNEKFNTNTELSDIVPTPKVDSNTIRSLTTPLSNKTIVKASITKSTDMSSKAESNSVQASIIPLGYIENAKPYITTELIDVIPSRADLTTIESKLESNFTNEKEHSASAVVEVSATTTNALGEITTMPSWKKYTTIVRKRVTSSEEISPSIDNDTDLAKAESIHTTITIPTTNTIKDSGSKANLLSSEIEPKIDRIATAELKPTFEPTQSFPSETLETITSKRAGFLDLSKLTSAQSKDASIVQETDFNTMYEIEATDIETQELKKVKGHESRQLAEDAIQEELMKEELINDHNENLKVYEASTGEMKQHIDNQKLLDLTTSQSMTDDKLSVQPINQERRTTLYTVGPNYKPMKRIEVQPAKPFIRDPDDNSWRNESISSLGIVFKPSNSSTKSFKEVLKTKTETEFNNLQDKEYKDNTPELRERLEKIAEVRKKKKKFDKFGEVVYIDYEEGGSAEGSTTNTPNSEIISLTTSSSEVPSTLPSIPQVEVTSPMTTTTEDTYWNKQLGMISKEDIFKDLGLDVLTTQKAKKPYNLAEYYDSTDEYDADYVTLPNIDLKKFTRPAPRKTTFPHLTSPLLLPTTRIVAPRFPERKPTVQYFPPTTKPQPVNVNDYDVGFEKRVELYTLTDAPNTNTPFEFERVATDSRSRTEVGPTAKPADFTMFTPHSSDAQSKQVYMAHERETEPHSIVIDDGNYTRGTYVIKHFRDFLSEAAKDDSPPDFDARTEPPREVTVAEFGGAGHDKIDYDYGSQLRKDILNRFVNNFNQNSDRFKVDFPVLFNSSVVHRASDDEGRVLAQSSTFMKRLYGNDPRSSRPGKVCDANCDHTMVELSPAYELHYFVPEEEEKEEVEPRPPAAAAALHRLL